MVKEETKRVEGLAVSIGRKLKAKEYDEFNILDEELGLTEDERKVYKHTLLSVGDLERDYGLNRYFKGSKKTNDEVMEEMGVSHGTYYKVRKSYLEGIAKEMSKKEEV